MELVGKKDHGGSGELPENCDQTKVATEALERLMEPEKRRGLSKVDPAVLDERRHTYFPAF